VSATKPAIDNIKRRRGGSREDFNVFPIQYDRKMMGKEKGGPTKVSERIRMVV